MLKRIRFATPAPTVGSGFATGWREAVGAALAAPAAARPLRVTVCTVVPDLSPDPKHAGVGLEWFRDAEHLSRYETWLDRDGDAARALGSLLEAAASPVVVAEEHVVRGEQWLAGRWRPGERRLKQMAIAV